MRYSRARNISGCHDIMSLALCLLPTLRLWVSLLYIPLQQVLVRLTRPLRSIYAQTSISTVEHSLLYLLIVSAPLLHMNALGWCSFDSDYGGRSKEAVRHG
ncbi:hypothetical protein BDZ89DRAFT_686758 [Hymenopellis radicata]|nr:hypothetical protein BDZ89DRAFT_686758 [Hymenopellis radicata]